MEWRRDPIEVERADRCAPARPPRRSSRTTGLSLVTDIEPDLPTIVGDRDRLIQVVINLISNAVKFTPSGTITCSAAARGRRRSSLAVADTGIGIAPEDHDTVFEQFRQAGDTLTDKPRGTGLGLPICREIVEHHGGRIWLESALGVGSDVRVHAASSGDRGGPHRGRRTDRHRDRRGSDRRAAATRARGRG